LHDLGLVENGGELVNAEDFAADTDIEVLVAFGRSVVIPVRSNNDPFAVVKTDEGGDFFVGGSVPETGSAVGGT